MVSFPPFPADPAQDFSSLELEARGCHLAEMALPSRWSLQSPACEPSTSPAVRRPGRTHGARACWLFTNPLAASLWRCSSKNTPNRCPQGVPAKGRAAAETVMRALLLRGKRQLPAPTLSTISFELVPTDQRATLYLPGVGLSSTRGPWSTPRPLSGSPSISCCVYTMGRQDALVLEMGMSAFRCRGGWCFLS